MTSLDLETPNRVLAIGAHPDDVEFGCGATLAKWAERDAEVHILVLTDGAKGSWDPSADLAELVATRIEEQEAAAKLLGARDTTNLGIVDGELSETEGVRAALCAAIRRVRPAVVVTHDPWKRYRLHPDHRHAGFVTIDALVAARDPHFFPEQGLEPFRPTALLLFEADEADHVERADATLDRKVESLLAHRSQWRSTLDVDPDDPDPGTSAVVERLRAEAITAGALAGVPLGEAFKLLTDL